MSRSWLETRFGVATIRLGRTGARSESQRGAGLDIVPLEEAFGDSRERPRWQTSVQALERMLQADSGRRLARRLRLVLANEFVRYALVPWKAERLTDAEREQFALALFAQRYGEREDRWRLVIEPQRFERPAHAAAVEAELLAALQGLAARNGLRLISVVPALVDELNRHRRRLGKVAGGWLVDASDGRLASLAFVSDAWLHVSNGPYAGSAAALAELLLPSLRRDALRMPELLAGTVFLANAEGHRVPGVIDQAWPVVSLQGAA